jgi:hypothetical protein
MTFPVIYVVEVLELIASIAWVGSTLPGSSAMAFDGRSGDAEG